MSPGWRQLTAQRVINFTPLQWLARASNWGCYTATEPRIVTCCFFSQDYSGKVKKKKNPLPAAEVAKLSETRGSALWHFLSVSSIWTGDRRFELNGHEPVVWNKRKGAGERLNLIREHCGVLLKHYFLENWWKFLKKKKSFHTLTQKSQFCALHPGSHFVLESFMEIHSVLFM